MGYFTTPDTVDSSDYYSMAKYEIKKWWKSDTFEKKIIHTKYAGPSFSILEKPKEGTLIFCCESDKAYYVTVTEVVRKIRSRCPNDTSCCLTLDFRCCVAVNGEVGNVQTNVIL